jgi:acetyl esterase/lipase
VEAGFYSPHIPKGVHVDSAQVADVTYDILSPKAFAKNRLIFYVHGGSFIAGSSRSYRTFCSLLADECSARLVLPNYRLAPAFPFPTGLEDLQNVFRQVFNKEQERFAQDLLIPPEIIIAGDGAGAGLAIALFLNLRAHIRVHVKHLVLLSPWLDLSSTSALRSAKKRYTDEVLNPKAYEACIDYYTYASNLDNPLVSPIYAEVQNFTSFPPVFIQMGSRESLLPDAERFSALLQENAIPCTLDVWPDMMHLFQMADEYLSESQKAICRLGSYIREAAKG